MSKIDTADIVTLSRSSMDESIYVIWRDENGIAVSERKYPN